MMVDRLKEIHSARPFRPFVLRISDQTAFRVTHPESLAYGPTGRTIVFIAPDDSAHHIDLLHVTRIEVGNGVRPRKKT